MSADISQNELKIIQEKKRAYEQAKKNGSTDLQDKARQYHDVF